MRTRNLPVGLGVGVLTLALAIGWARGDEPPAVKIGPGTIIVLGQGQLQGGLSSSLAYLWDGKDEKPPLLFSRAAPFGGEIHALAVARDGQHYHLCHNRFLITRADKDGERTFFTHTTYVRDVALDGDDNVYFSEASGG